MRSLPAIYYIEKLGNWNEILYLRQDHDYVTGHEEYLEGTEAS